MIPASEIASRAFIENDEHFVLNSWLKSFRTSNYAGIVLMSDYYDVYRRTLEYIIGRPETKIIVACNPEETDPDHGIYGWLCYERQHPAVVHYVYVKQPYRKHGVARFLFEQAGITGEFIYTFRTSASTACVMKNRLPGRWNPLLARFNEGEHREDKASAIHSCGTDSGTFYRRDGHRHDEA